MPGAPSSFLFLVALRPGAPSSVLAPKNVWKKNIQYSFELPIAMASNLLAMASTFTTSYHHANHANSRTASGTPQDGTCTFAQPLLTDQSGVSPFYKAVDDLGPWGRRLADKVSGLSTSALQSKASGSLLRSLPAGKVKSQQTVEELCAVLLLMQVCKRGASACCIFNHGCCKLSAAEGLASEKHMQHAAYISMWLNWSSVNKEWTRAP